MDSRLPEWAHIWHLQDHFPGLQYLLLNSKHIISWALSMELTLFLQFPPPATEMVSHFYLVKSILLFCGCMWHVLAQRLEHHAAFFCSVPYLLAMLDLVAVPTLHWVDNPGSTFFWKSQQRRSLCMLRSWLKAQNAHLSWGTLKSFSVSQSLCSHRKLID